MIARATLVCLAIALTRAAEPVYWGKASSENGEVCLGLPAVLVDWHAVAIRSLGARRFTHPSPDLLRPGLVPEQGNSVSVPFEAPVPADVRSRAWLVLYRGGATLVVPTVLRGNVTYFFDSTLTLTEEPVADGTACVRGQTPQAAAFFVSGATVHATSLDRIRVVAVAPDTFAIVIDGNRAAFARPSFAFPKVSHVTLFRSDRDEGFVLIEWDPGDGSNCQSSFSLVPLSAAPSAPPLENGYGCDL